MKKILSTMTVLSSLSLANAMQDVERLEKSIGEVTRAVQAKIAEAGDATRVIIVGATGQGKSTLANLLAGFPLVVGENNGFPCLEAPEETPFPVVAGMSSATRTPNLWHDSGVVYCDCPGFFDTSGPNQEIINAFAIDQLFREARGIKILLVAKHRTITDRGSGNFRDQLERLERLVPGVDRFPDSVALIITEGFAPPEKYLGGVADESASGLLRFFADRPDRVFSFPCPKKKDLGMHYGDRNRSIVDARGRILEFLRIGSVVHPEHRISLNDGSLRMLESMVADFCRVELSLKRFADLTLDFKEEDPGVDKLDKFQRWLPVIDDLMGIDTPNGFVRKIKGADFWKPYIPALGGILEEIDGFQHFQHFLTEVAKIESIMNGRRSLFMERANLKLFEALNPILQNKRKELEQLIQHERELELGRRITCVLGYAGLNPMRDLISHRSSDVLAMDIVVDDTIPRYNFLKEIYYKKFLPFKDLFGREDLGVVATKEYLEIIEKYINDTKISKKPIHPGTRVDDAGFQWIGGGWVVHNFWFAERWGCGCGATGWCPQEKGTYDECQRFYAAHFVPALARYDNALAEWSRKNRERNAEIEKAGLTIFPSDIFDRVADQVNWFFVIHKQSL